MLGRAPSLAQACLVSNAGDARLHRSMRSPLGRSLPLPSPAPALRRRNVRELVKTYSLQDQPAVQVAELLGEGALLAGLVVGMFGIPRLMEEEQKEESDQEKTEVRLCGVPVDNRLLQQKPVKLAAELAMKAHAGQRRRTGEDYVVHCIETARIVCALLGDPPKERERVVMESILAAILHDVLDDTNCTLRELELALGGYGAAVGKLVVSVSRLSQTNQMLRRRRRARKTEDKQRLQQEHKDVRRLIVGMVDDPRAVIIKLGDRLHNMRTLWALPRVKQKAVATETLFVWCPLASRLGMPALKAELEDLCFAVLDPVNFWQTKITLESLWKESADPRVLESFEEAQGNYPLINELLARGEPEEAIKYLLETVMPFDLINTGVSNDRNSFEKNSASTARLALSDCESQLNAVIQRRLGYVPGMEVTLYGRLKSLYSTYTKAKRKGISIAEVYDTRALRVVVGDKQGAMHESAVITCYRLLMLVHSLWYPVTGEFDDYIANPKETGYQSLHTAVIPSKDGAPLEVQIRTQNMHDVAELGTASHWLYKEDTVGSSTGSRSQFVPLAPYTPNVNARNGEDDEPSQSTRTVRRKRSKSVRLSPDSITKSRILLEEEALRRQAASCWVGQPVRRIKNDQLLDGVIADIQNGGAKLIVAVYFKDRLQRSKSGGNVDWTAYEEFALKVSKRGWKLPQQGDLTTSLETYNLCRDGIFHKTDVYGRTSSQTYIQPLLLTEEQRQRMEGAIGGEILARPDEPFPDANDEPVPSAQLDKAQLLRLMLQWEQEMDHTSELLAEADTAMKLLEDNQPSSEGSLDNDLKSLYESQEVLVVDAIDGHIISLPKGATAADALRQNVQSYRDDITLPALTGNGFLLGSLMVKVNGQCVPMRTVLKDGDMVEMSDLSKRGEPLRVGPRRSGSGDGDSRALETL
mmetsp:Transcript_4693/g.16808  ORF Transcript_4693/g.16808 Transcript_4693/m.16808 type:complete len:924 (-) Transcript_4693:79-2850(-)